MCLARKLAGVAGVQLWSHVKHFAAVAATTSLQRGAGKRKDHGTHTFLTLLIFSTLFGL
jgi:hypothetical protein